MTNGFSYGYGGEVVVGGESFSWLVAVEQVETACEMRSAGRRGVLRGTSTRTYRHAAGAAWTALLAGLVAGTRTADEVSAVSAAIAAA